MGDGMRTKGSDSSTPTAVVDAARQAAAAGGAGKLVTLDLLKGCCALWVIMLHSFPGGGCLTSCS